MEKHRLRGELLKNIFHVRSSYENSSKDLGERLVHFDWIFPQNCRNTLLLHIVDQLVRTSKYKKTFYLSELWIKHNRMDLYHTVKAWESFPELLPKILGILSQFYEMQTGGWRRELLYVVKTVTITKWELNTCNDFMNFRLDDFFVG